MNKLDFRANWTEFWDGVGFNLSVSIGRIAHPYAAARRNRYRERRRVPAADAPVPTPIPRTPSSSMVKRTVNVRENTIRMMKTAVKKTREHPGGAETMTALVNAALERELARLADEFNGGEPFEPSDDNLKPGRPV